MEPNAEQNTLERIQAAARAEFLEKGFSAASLRNIVKTTGVTTGAFYGYFSSKEALFASLVEPCAAALMGKFMQLQTDFAELPQEEQPGHMGVESGEYVAWMLEYMYDHRVEFKLLLCCSGGTSYEHFIDRMAEVEVEATLHYIEVLRGLGRTVPEISRELCHMIVSGMFNSIFEVLRHDMPREQAKRFVSQLLEFDTAGWAKIMGQ